VFGLLSVATVLSFSPVFGCDFVNLDDDEYVTKNVHVLAGLTDEGFAWAWNGAHAANWHPLTWLSLMLDAQLFGKSPLGFHLTNLLLHLANMMLVFVLLRQWTAALWPSALVAALFAVHPLHVESVAWVTERKDVLSTFFGLLALLAYTSYARAPRASAYFLALLFFTLSLLAKSMLVTLPILLLLVDYWPLRRFQGTPSLRRLILEKLPFFALSFAFSAITLWAQRRAVTSLVAIPFNARLANALLSYLAYLRQTVLPIDLAVFYPHPRGKVQFMAALAAAGVLVLLTAFAYRWRRAYSFAFVGWLWFLGTLVPVIGLAQVGGQARADRYTYFPHIGLFIIVACGGAELVRRLQRPLLAAGIAALVLLQLAIRTWSQTTYWQNSFTLFDRAIEVTNGSSLAYYNLGVAWKDAGKPAEAIKCYERALEFDPNSASTHNNLGGVLLDERLYSEAAREFQEAIRLDPKGAGRYANLGQALRGLGNWAESADCFRSAVVLDPETAIYRRGLAFSLWKQGLREEAAAEYQEALRLEPGWLSSARNSAWIFAADPDAGLRNGRIAEQLAEQLCQATAEQDPEMLDILAAAYGENGKFAEAHTTALRAAALAAAKGEVKSVAAIQSRLRLYENKQPYRLIISPR
jgi:tetratricopeptide (TPR) repeat protein